MHNHPSETALRTLLTEVSKKDLTAASLDDDLVFVLGLDSLGALRLLAAVEKHFHVRFPDGQLGDFRTLQSLLDFLVHSAQEPPS